MNQLYVHIYPLPLGPPTLPSHPSRLSQSTELSLCYKAASHWLFILHVVAYICQCYSPSLNHPSLPTLCPYVCSLHLRLSSCLQIGSSSFWRKQRCSCPANTTLHSYTCCVSTCASNVSRRPSGEDNCHMRTGVIAVEGSWGITDL